MSKRQQAWRVGKIDSKEYDDLAPQGKARVFWTDKQPGMLSKPLPVLFPFTGVDKVYAMPKVGDRVVVLTDENSEDGIIMGSIYTKQNPPIPDDPNIYSVDFGDGTKVEYDKNNHELTVTVNGGDMRLSADNIYLN